MNEKQPQSSPIQIPIRRYVLPAGVLRKVPFVCQDIRKFFFSFRSVQLADNAEIRVRLMPGISSAGERRSVLVSTLLHRTRIVDSYSHSKLTEAVNFFVCILVVPV
jgi:hypothetical protein